MNDFLNGLKKEMNYTETENGAGALKSTMNHCLDAFGSLAAMKDSDPQMIIDTFKSAYDEDRDLALRLLFYVRDIRGGQGMRRVFRILINWLSHYDVDSVINNFDNFIEFGRVDDLFALFGTEIEGEMINYVKTKLAHDVLDKFNEKPISLMAKWMPSINASSDTTRARAKVFCKAIFGNTSASAQRRYRQLLSDLRSYLEVVETSMSANKWSDIKYENVPGKASLNYTKAFARHDEDRYMAFIKEAALNKVMNANALFPYDIIHKIYKNNRPTETDRHLYDAMWGSLPNYFEGLEETGICVVDTSGSMHGTPIEVALSLGMYCADKCAGPFKNHFITFSHTPHLVEFTGKDIVDKVGRAEDADWGMNTNLEAVFRLILTTGVRNKLTNDQMPKKLYIISDMQFDEATDYDYYTRNYQNGTFMDRMEAAYTSYGYTMPMIVYWNVRASKCGMFQKTYQGKQCCMVSGYSSSLFKAVITGTTYETVTDENGNTKEVQKLDPMTVMYNTLLNPRYDCVWTPQNSIMNR